MYGLQEYLHVKDYDDCTVIRDAPWNVIKHQYSSFSDVYNMAWIPSRGYGDVYLQNISNEMHNIPSENKKTFDIALQYAMLWNHNDYIEPWSLTCYFCALI